jgi:hypothetical protein
VFQRTPQWLFDHPGYTKPYPPQVNWLDRNLPLHSNFMRFRSHYLGGPYLSEPKRLIDPDFDDPHARSAVNKRLRDERIRFIESKFPGRPDLVEKMIPPYPPYATRPVQVDRDHCYYDAVQRDDVTLVTEGIDRITPRGIRTIDGTEHELDAIVYATGFRANECLWPMEVRGRGGLSVEELWAKDGPRAHLGTMLPGFPNLFMVYGPNMNPYGGLGVVNHEEMVVRYLLSCIGVLLTEERRSIEPTEEAYWRWNAELDEREARKIYRDPRARSPASRCGTGCGERTPPTSSCVDPGQQGASTPRIGAAISSGVTADTPPSTGSVTPVIQRASSLARNAAAHATSQPVPSVPSRFEAAAIRWRCSVSAVTPRFENISGVVMCPGATTLTRIPWRPWLKAMSTASACMPPLAAA